MSLVRRSNSKFWYVQFQLHNRTFVKSTRTTDRRIAAKIAEKIRSEVHSRIFLQELPPITLREALEQYVESRAGTANFKNLAGHSRSILRHFSSKLLLTELSSRDIERYVRARASGGAKPQTIKHSINCIGAAIRHARRSGYQCPEIEMPTIRILNSRLRYLSFDEEQALLAELDPNVHRAGMGGTKQRRWLRDNYDLVILLLDTGARYGEIAGLRWSQLDFERRVIKLWRPKVRNESVIYMTERVAALLAARSQLRSSEFVFTNNRNGPRGHSSIAIRKAFARAGLHDCTIHTLRHTHATRLIQNGLSVYEVKEVLGHSDIKTTMRYAHLEREAVTRKARDVIESLRSTLPVHPSAPTRR